MKIVQISKFDLDCLDGGYLDAVIVASGYESRARTVVEERHLDLVDTSTQRCAWGFTEYADDPVRVKNDTVLRQLGFKIHLIKGGDGKSPEKWISELLSRRRDRPVRLLVDISSMTRTWYGGIVKALSVAKHPFPVSSIVAYTPSVWSESHLSTPPNEIVGPVPGYASNTLPNKPAALVIGLGKEEDRALGLKDYVDPCVTVCFYAAPGGDRRYVSAAKRANRDFLSLLPPDCIYTYDLFDTFGTYKTLESVCQGLSRDYRVVLASLGPKVLGLFCFLIHTNMPEVSVWRVSPATRQPPFDHKPSRRRVVLKIDWQ